MANLENLKNMLKSKYTEIDEACMNAKGKAEQIEKLRLQSQPLLKKISFAEKCWYVSLATALPIFLTGLLFLPIIAIPIITLSTSIIAKRVIKRKYKKKFGDKLAFLSKEYLTLEDSIYFKKKHIDILLKKITSLEKEDVVRQDKLSQNKQNHTKDEKIIEL